MNILIKPDPSSIFQRNRVFEIDNGDNFLFGFKKKLEKLGITINTLDLGSKERVDWIIFFDFPWPWDLGYIIKLLLNKDKSILFCIESPVINPLGQRKFFHKFFHSVYTWNDKLIDNKKVKKFYYPVLNTNLNFKEVPYERKRLLCVLNSNISVPYPLILLSPFKKVLYPERLKAIIFFEKAIPEEFSLFGRGWNAPMKFSIKEKIFGYKTYTSFKGAIPRKLDYKLKILSKFKFNLCFENCVADGYISEKIMHCFEAHTIPIYLGAPNIEKYIPKSCFIDFREFKDYPALLDFLNKMNEKSYNKYLENGKKLLKSKKFLDTWFEDGFLKFFLRVIQN